MIHWIKFEEIKPKHNQLILCKGNRTYCCEEDMNKTWYHVARYDNKPCEWDVNMNPIAYTDTCYIEDVEPCDHLENVTYWAEFNKGPI